MANFNVLNNTNISFTMGDLATTSSMTLTTADISEIINPDGSTVFNITFPAGYTPLLTGFAFTTSDVSKTAVSNCTQAINGQVFTVTCTSASNLAKGTAYTMVVDALSN